MKFENLNLSQPILDALEDLKFESMTPVQEKSLPTLLEGFDMLVEAPTGTGKTCAYSLPIIENIDVNNDKVQALIICPTRELAIQSVKEIRNFYKYKQGCSSLPIYGGQQISRQIMLLKKKPNIIVGTPGRILDHLARHTLKFDNIKYVVLDECDEMLDMGFKPDIDSILKDIKSDHQTMLFSATISNDIKSIAKTYLKENHCEIHIEKDISYKELIDQYYLITKEEEKKKTLLNLLYTIEYKQLMIFCRTKAKVDRVFNLLKNNDFKAVALHGGYTQRQRDDAMKNFRKLDANILIATDVAARGLDIPQVDFVINYDIPDEDEFYIHRIGRTGRANKKGSSISFITKKEKYFISKYEEMCESKIKQYFLLKEKEVVKIMARKELESLKDTVLNDNLSEYEKIIKDYMAEIISDNNTSISPVTFAAALLKKAVENKSKLDKEESHIKEHKHTDESVEFRATKGRNHSVSIDSKRLFVNLGKVDGLNENKLAQYVIDNCGIEKSDLIDVYVKGTFSFIEVSNDLVSLVCMAMNSCMYNDRQVNVEVSSEKTHTKPKKDKKKENKKLSKKLSKKENKKGKRK